MASVEASHKKAQSPDKSVKFSRREVLNLIWMSLAGLGAYEVDQSLKKISAPGKILKAMAAAADTPTPLPPTAEAPLNRIKELENGQSFQLDVAVLSQQDPQWAGLNLGYNNPSEGYTIGGYGCLIASMSMYLIAQGQTAMTPDKVNELLIKKHGYVAGGGLFSPKEGPPALGLTTSEVSADYSNAPVDDVGLAFVRDHVSAGQPLLAQVDFNIQTPRNEMHYVLVTGIGKDGNGNYRYTYMDPWDGQRYTVDQVIFARKGVKFYAYDKKIPGKLVKSDTLPLADLGQTTIPAIAAEPEGNPAYDMNAKLQGNYTPAVARWAPQIVYYAKKNNLPPELAAALITIEDPEGDPKAHSICEAIGMTQVMPRDGDMSNACYAQYSYFFTGRPTVRQLENPDFNINYGLRILSGLLQAKGSIREALKSYGPLRVGYKYADDVLAVWQQDSPATYQAYMGSH